MFTKSSPVPRSGWSPFHHGLALVTVFASDGEWVELDATFDAPTCAGMEFVLYVEGPPADVAFHIDDASLVVQD